MDGLETIFDFVGYMDKRPFTPEYIKRQRLISNTYGAMFGFALLGVGIGINVFV
jgi:hypothetical protein